MAKFLRPNKVVIVLNGRYAGKKAVIVKNMYRFIVFCFFANTDAFSLNGWMDKTWHTFHFFWECEFATSFYFSFHSSFALHVQRAKV